MLIDFVSDLHVDHTPFSWETVNADRGRVLIIAGDVSNSPAMTKQVITEAAALYEDVVFVDGNHEHYASKLEPHAPTIVNVMGELRDFAAGQKNVHYLDGGCFQVDDVAFVGANGWYDWNIPDVPMAECEKHWRNLMNDVRLNYGHYGNPRNLAEAHAAAVRQTVTRLAADANVRHIIAVTHSSPRFDLLHPSFRVGRMAALSGSYCNSQMADIPAITPKLTHWVYGHTHSRNDVMRDGCRFMNNIRGYGGEMGNWTIASFDTEEHSVNSAF